MKNTKQIRKNKQTNKLACSVVEAAAAAVALHKVARKTRRRVPAPQAARPSCARASAGSGRRGGGAILALSWRRARVVLRFGELGSEAQRDDTR